MKNKQLLSCVNDAWEKITSYDHDDVIMLGEDPEATTLTWIGKLGIVNVGQHHIPEKIHYIGRIDYLLTLI